jgi:hypothetical protein
MTRATALVIAGVFAATLACSAASAQRPHASERSATASSATPLPKPAQRKSNPSPWEQTKTMTLDQWNRAKRHWAMEKVKWRNCNREAYDRNLDGAKSWSFIAHCMTR